MNHEAIYIRINKVDDIKKFVAITESFDSDIDVIKGRYIIDAKSLLGLYSLDLSEAIGVRINTDSDDELVKFQNAMEEFLA